jgi:type IV secretory pathway VirB3-like protein
MHVVDNVSDSVKMATATVTPVLALAGVPLEQWVFVLSAILTILFIIEKIPKAFVSIMWMYRKIVRKQNAPSK